MLFFSSLHKSRVVSGMFTTFNRLYSFSLLQVSKQRVTSNNRIRHWLKKSSSSSNSYSWFPISTATRCLFSGMLPRRFRFTIRDCIFTMWRCTMWRSFSSFALGLVYPTEHQEQQHTDMHVGSRVVDDFIREVGSEEIHRLFVLELHASVTKCSVENAKEFKFLPHGCKGQSKALNQIGRLLPILGTLWRMTRTRYLLAPS